jgi:hypothetical protein
MGNGAFGSFLDQCLAIQPGEQVVMLTDRGTDEAVIGGLCASIEARDGVPLVARMPEPHLPGAEPPGAERGRLTAMLDRCADPQMTNLAEVSVAFNPNGTVCDVPMETESARGTAHVALGNSLAYGGVVDAVAHLDCVMRAATLELDGRAVMINGAVQ